jgi:MFS family permease
MDRLVALIQKRFYYGWSIVGLAMICMAFWYAFRTVFSIFFVALIDHFHWSRAEAAGAQSIGMLVYMATAPAVGYLVDRVGPRKVMLPGIFLMGLGLLLCTQINSLLHFYIYFGLIAGTGVTFLSISPLTAILSHWFEKKRGMANGLASVGIGFGPLLFVPLVQYLINLRGWSFAFFIFALLVFLVPLPLIGLFMRHRPEDMGLTADGRSQPSPSQTVDFRKGIPDQRLRDLIKTVKFWLFLLFPALMILGVYVIIVHHVKYLVDLGVDRIWAASLFAAVGALSAGFRFFWGWFSDRAGRKITYTLGGICFSFGIVCLILYQTSPSAVFLYLFAILFGAGWGSHAPMFMSIAGDLYKGRRFGLIYGMLEGMIGVGAAAGSWLGGYLFDQTQSYFLAFLIAILSCILSVSLAWSVGPQKARFSSSVHLL